VDQTFLYHALAVGASGQITTPLQHTIEVQAPSALPFTGGYSASEAREFRYANIVSFVSASTVTSGSESAGTFNTLATAAVEGLNILNVVTADRLVARLATRYTPASKERAYSYAGSHFVNLHIAGRPVNVTIDPERRKSLRQSESARFGTLALATGLDGTPGVEVVESGVIRVPHFGTIYLGEVLVTRCYQTLSMLRVELGCAVEGKMALAHVSTNGEPMPG